MKVVPILIKYLSDRSYKLTGSSIKDQYQTFKKISTLFPDLMVDDLNPKWVQEFNQMMISNHLHPNTVWKHHKNFKIFVKIMMADGLLLKDPYIGFDNKQHRTYKTWVLDDEIKVIENMQLSDELLRYCRDFFMISYLSLLRFSDVNRVSKSQIQINGPHKYLKITTIKTGENVVIPVGDRLERILDHFIPMRYGNNKINTGLKLLFENAGLTRKVEEVVITNHNGGVKKEYKEVPLYKSITIHTARRSAITSLVLSGVPPIDIMPISGHRTEKALMVYIGVDGLKAAEKLSTHKFFQ